MLPSFDVLGFLVSWGTFLGIYAILAVSLNLEVGLTGMANFGKVAFYGIGAYLAASLSVYAVLAVYHVAAAPYTTEGIIALGKYGGASPALDLGIFAASLVLGFIIAGCVGYLLTYPTLRVGPAFLGITLLAFGELLRIFLLNYQPLGASKGLSGIPHPFLWIPDPVLRERLYVLVVLGFLAVTLWFAERITNSPFGRVLKAVRDDEVAALCMGKHVPRVKATVLFIGSGMAGVAGVLLAFYMSSVNPNMFVPAVTFNIWAMVILGGMGNNKGAVVGAAIITFVDRILTFITPNLGITIITPDYVRWMIVGILIVLVLMFMPGGLVPEKPIKTPAWEAVESLEKESKEGGSGSDEA